MPEGNRKDRIRQLARMKSHLMQLEALMGRVVHRDELLSLEQTVLVKQQLSKFTVCPIVSREIPFDDRKAGRFSHFIQQLSLANSSSVYVWIHHGFDCGLLLASSLDVVDVLNFPFEPPNEVVSFITSDLRDRLLFDSTTEPETRTLTIEVQGDHWLDVNY